MKLRISAAAIMCAFFALTIGAAKADCVNDGRCTSAMAGRYSARAVASSGGQVVAHPSGCPRRLFCGCGVSVKVFGRPVRDLFLAANWMRKFPRTSPAAGMVAARRGHVFYIMSYLGEGKALAYDPNSGGRKTRVHVRSLAGYVVVNPHGSVAVLR